MAGRKTRTFSVPLSDIGAFAVLWTQEGFLLRLGLDGRCLDEVAKLDEVQSTCLK